MRPMRFQVCGVLVSLGALVGACESDGAAGDADTTGGGDGSGVGDKSITIKKPAYADGTLETVLRHEGVVPVRIETEDASQSAQMMVDGGAGLALTKASDYAFEGQWTISKADNGPHTLTFKVTAAGGAVSTKTHSVRVLVWDRHDDLDTRSYSGWSPVLKVDEGRQRMWLLYRVNAGDVVEIDLAKKGLTETGWTHETVVPHATYQLADGGGHTPWHLSMALDSNGNPHFASVWDQDGDNMNIGLGYFSWDGSTWKQEMAVAALERKDAGQPDAFPYYSWEGSNVSVSLDKQDTPHIIYYRNLATTASVHNGSLWHATKDGATWKNELLTDDIGDVNQPVGFDRAALASAWDAGGTRLMVRYATHDGGSGALKYALWSTAGWQHGTISSELSDYTWDRGSESSLTYVGGKWYTSFHAQNGTNDLYLATYDGTAWTTELVDAKGLGEYSAIAVTAAGDKVITYRGQQNSLRLAWQKGGIWTTTEIGLETEVEQVRLGDPGQTQVYLDGTGLCHVAFYNTYKKVMEYWTASLAD